MRATLDLCILRYHEASYHFQIHAKMPSLCRMCDHKYKMSAGTVTGYAQCSGKIYAFNHGLLTRMTRSNLIDQLAQRFPQFVLKDCQAAVGVILEAIGHTLKGGGRVEIRGFGTFALNYRPPRTGRNPKTGDKVPVPEKWTPHFRPGKELRELVDQRP